MNELDKIFQSKLENHTTEYSPQSWDKIEARLNSHKTKPRKLPWLWMSLATVVVVGAIYLLLPSVGDNSNSATASSNSGADNAVASTDVSNKKASAYADTNSNEISKSTESNQTISNPIEQGKRSQESLSNDNQINKKISKSKASNGNQLKTNRTKLFASTINELQINRNTQAESAYGTNDSVTNTSSNIETSSNVEETLSRNNISNVNVVGLTTNDLIVGVASKELAVRPLRTIGVSSFTKLFSNKEDVDIKLSKSMMDDFRQDCPSFVTDRTGVYLDFYVSHELPFSNLSAKNSEFDAFQELRSETEGPTYSFSAGVRLTLMLPNGLGLKTGLNYSQVNEKFSFVDPETDMVKQVITITTVNGMEVRDTNSITIPGSRDVVSTNTYRTFDIPLLLSYEWDVRERTYMTVNGGIYLNLLFKESGKILDTSGEVIDFTDASIFKNNIGLSLFGSVGLHYRWNSNIDFILEPNVRLLVKSVTVEGYPLDHKWITGGLITGMRYNF